MEDQREILKSLSNEALIMRSLQILTAVAEAMMDTPAKKESVRLVKHELFERVQSEINKGGSHEW